MIKIYEILCIQLFSLSKEQEDLIKKSGCRILRSITYKHLCALNGLYVPTWLQDKCESSKNIRIEVFDEFHIHLYNTLSEEHWRLIFVPVSNDKTSYITYDSSRIREPYVVASEVNVIRYGNE